MPTLRSLLYIVLLFILGGCLPGTMNWLSSTNNRNTGTATDNGVGSEGSEFVQTTTGDNGTETDGDGEDDDERDLEGSENGGGGDLENYYAGYGFFAGTEETQEIGRGMVELADGRTVIGFSKKAPDGTGGAKCGVLFLNSDGAVDTTVQGDSPGVTLINIQGEVDCQVNTLALQGEKILVGGWVQRSNGKNLYLTRLMKTEMSYEVDPQFGGSGLPNFSLHQPGGLPSEVSAIAVRPSGDFAIAGSLTEHGHGPRIIIGRFSPHGVPVMEFGPDQGFRVITLNQMDGSDFAHANALLIDETNQSEPKFYIAAELHSNNSIEGALAAIDNQGNMYARPGGSVQYFTERHQRIKAMAWQSRNTEKFILLAGVESEGADARAFVTRIGMETGFVDSTFNNGHVSMGVQSAHLVQPISIGISNGKIVVPSTFSVTGMNKSAIFTLDADHGTGVINTAFTEYEVALNALVTDLGQVIMTGYSYSGNTNILFRRQSF